MLILVCVFFLQGIEWTNIEYFNNAIICDLIENVSQAEFVSSKNNFVHFFVMWTPFFFFLIQKLYIIFKI